MGIYSEKQREQISIEALNRMFRINTKGRVQSYISDNDKEPMWDGHIYVYKESGSEQKNDFLFRIPVQVKSKEVSKFDNKFISYPIERSCLDGYLNDGGIIYFVVEIIIDDNGDYRTEIFYKVMVPSVLKDILENTDGNQGKKSVHINKFLNSKDEFLKACYHFHRVRQIEGVDLIKNRVPIDKVLDKKIQILTLNGINDVFTGDYCSYYVDENNIKVPVKLSMESVECEIRTNYDFSKDDKTYFNNYTRHFNSNGEEFIIIGDTIKLSKNKIITITSSQYDICLRHKTIEYFLNELLDKDYKFKGEEAKTIERLKVEREFIEKIFEVCKRFNIDSSTIKLKDFTNEDYNAIELLASVIDYNGTIDRAKDIKPILVKLLNYKIVLFKIICNDGTVIYYDYYTEKIKVGIVWKNENKNIVFSRFALSNEKILTAYNFNEEVVKESLILPKDGNETAVAEQYNLFMLYLIKSWDIEHKQEYINLIKYIDEIIDGLINEDIEFINKAQIEYRLSNKSLSHKTRDKLYKIKFKENVQANIKCAVCILLEDYEGFDENYNSLTQQEKEEFMAYPIYSLYENKHTRERT